MISTVSVHPASVETGSLLSTTETAKRLGVTVDTVLDWINHGVPINGQRIKLHAKRYGIRWKLTPESIDEFAARCSAVTGVNHAE